MIDLSVWMPQYLEALKKAFRERIWFVGLQGSYGRGEATENSDLDLVVILDQLTASDVRKYSDMLNTLPHRELICGFLSGKAEIMNWDDADFFQFFFDTKPILGSLEEMKCRINEYAVKRAIHMGVCNIYHGCVHNMLYGKSNEALKGLYKSASFVVQAICFYQTGTYVTHLDELIRIAEAEEQAVVETFRRLKHGEIIDFETGSDMLFAWASKWINGMNE